MFGIRNLEGIRTFVDEKVICPFPQVLDGKELYDTVCPVSKETGLRESSLGLLNKVLDPRYSHLAQQVLQVIPSINDPQGISDDDALDFIAGQFDTGSAYDNQELRESLASALDVLLPGRSEAVRSGQILFKDSDKEVKDSE